MTLLEDLQARIAECERLAAAGGDDAGSHLRWAAHLRSLARKAGGE